LGSRSDAPTTIFKYKKFLPEHLVIGEADPSSHACRLSAGTTTYDSESSFIAGKET